MTARDDWLEWRRGGIGASDVPGILGISPYSSPWSVWADKAGMLPDVEDEYMIAGRWLEAAIGPWFTHETALNVAGEQMQCTHREHNHHRCTVDGFVFETAGEMTLDHALGDFEVKTTGPGARWETIPGHYQAQGQWQMHVTDMERVWFAVLMGRRLDIHVLERDQADIDLMVKRVDAFWTDHVLTGTPPAVDATDATRRAIAAVYPHEIEGTSVELGRDNRAEIAAWLDARAAVKAAKEDEQAYSNLLRAELRDAETGLIDGQRLLTLRAQTRKTTCRACGHVEESDPFRVLRYHPPKETA